MAEVINMPRLSDTMEEGTVATWLKKVGDTVKEGDILAEIETDKATMEFESFYEGTLLHIGIKEGETAKVDSLLAIIGKKDEDISDLIDGKSSDKKSEKDDSKKEEKSSDKKKTSNDEDAELKGSGENSKETNEENEESASSENGEGSSSGAERSSSGVEMPEGVEVITMPRLSDTMTEGTVATWLKKEGDKVEEGDILAEIETDKGTMEFESFYSGTLLKIGIGEGESAWVDALLAIIGPKGTDVSGIAENFKKVGTASEKTERSSEENPSKEDKKDEKVQNDEKAEKGVRGTSQKEETSTKKENTKTSSDTRIFASPLAKKLAEDKGINLRQVAGSGENGRIVKSDIENYQPAAGGGQAYTPVGTESFEEVKNSQMSKTIAKRLAESKFTAPEYYLTIELDMDQAIAAREAINANPDVKISFNDMIIKACAMALRKHPQVNSLWTPEVTKIAKHIHIGVAVAVDEGLLVPVLRSEERRVGKECRWRRSAE